MGPLHASRMTGAAGLRPSNQSGWTVAAVSLEPLLPANSPRSHPSLASGNHGSPQAAGSPRELVTPQPVVLPGQPDARDGTPAASAPSSARSARGPPSSRNRAQPSQPPQQQEQQAPHQAGQEPLGASAGGTGDSGDIGPGPRKGSAPSEQRPVAITAVATSGEAAAAGGEMSGAVVQEGERTSDRKLKAMVSVAVLSVQRREEGQGTEPERKQQQHEASRSGVAVPVPVTAGPAVEGSRRGVSFSVARNGSRSGSSSMTAAAGAVMRSLVSTSMDARSAVASMRHMTKSQSTMHRKELQDMSLGKLRLTSMKYLELSVSQGQRDEKGKALSRLQLWRWYIHRTMTQPSTSRLALVISIVTAAAIVVSTISFCMETVPALDKHDAAHATFNMVDAVTVQIFLADYLLRVLTAATPLRYMVEPLNIIDLISILPWYILLVLGSAHIQGTQVFRVVRIARVFRVFKLGARYQKFEIVMGALAKSWDMLLLMVFFVSFAIITFSSLMYFAEKGTWDEALGYFVRPDEPVTLDDGNPQPSPYSSIPESFWWCIVTLMTVGYGDVYPVTPGGKLIAGVAMIFGILALALPISVIGTNFSQAWSDHKRALEEGEPEPSTVPKAVLALDGLLQDHTRDVTDLVHMFSKVEAGLEELRSKLHDKVKTRRREIDRELAMQNGQHLPRPSLNGPQRSLPSVTGWKQPRQLGAHDSNDAHDDVNGGGGNGGGHHSTLHEVDIQSRLQELLGNHAVSKYNKDLHEMVELESAMSEKSQFLSSLLALAQRLRHDGLPASINALRFRYRQLLFLRQSTADMKSSLDEMSSEVQELQLILADLESWLQKEPEITPVDLSGTPGGGSTGTGDGDGDAAATGQLAKRSRRRRGKGGGSHSNGRAVSIAEGPSPVLKPAQSKRLVDTLFKWKASMKARVAPEPPDEAD